MIRKRKGDSVHSRPPQHRLYFLPEPHGHGSFRPTSRSAAFASQKIGSDVRGYTLPRGALGQVE